MSTDDPLLDEMLVILARVGEAVRGLPPGRHRDDRPPIEKLPAIDSPAAAALDADDLEALWRARTWMMREQPRPGEPG